MDMADAVKFQPSKYQSAIFDWIRRGTGSAIVKAVAGSGKTTTVIRGVEYFPRTAEVQLVAFNRDIVTEMEIRLRALEEEIGRNLPNVRVSTFHSLGFSALRSRLKPRRFTVDDRKLGKLVPKACGYNEVLVDLYTAFVTKLVGYAKGEGIGVLVDDKPESWKALIDHHGLYLDDKRATEEQAIEIARDLLRCSNEHAGRPQEYNGRSDLSFTIDYADMLYLPLLWQVNLWCNDVLIIDEAQDTNRVRREIAKRALGPDGRLMAVGDPCQSIYGFTGATPDAMDRIQSEFGCIELPLTVSYRCAKSIINRAQAIVPYLEAFEGSPEGDVMTLDCATAVNYLQPTDAVLCRMTAPLVGFAFDLIRHGIGCRVLGRDIGAGLISLIKKRDAVTVDELVEALEIYRDEEVAKCLRQDREEKAAGIKDRVDCVLTVIDELPRKERTIEALVGRLTSLFDDDDGAGLLTLSTIHKAKGKEWDSVAILAPELMPCKWARQEWEHVQERNLMYVAWTRAKSALIDLDDDRIGERKPVRIMSPLPPPPSTVIDDEFLERDLPPFLDRRRRGGAQS
jgi:DNA helicase II / ATP-dependent DNA helicase PcrA